MNYELDCKWHFAERVGDGDNGPNSAMSQHFQHFPCSALVRESIQNSLDAVLDSSNPVVVCFDYRSFEKGDYENFFKIEEHIEAGRLYYSRNPTADVVYPGMLRYLRNTNEVGFIRVSDYNTKGMDYVEGQTNKTFYAFVRSEGVSVKQQAGAGGSFGFGKGAFFVMSPINTLIVSTRNSAGECFFEGVTRLCSHMIDGKMYSHMGFYDNNNGYPTNDFTRIPLPFRREDSGTSIGIMGITKESWNDSIEGLIKEVLSNFFVAILRNKLVVYINGRQGNPGAIEINASTIRGLMEKYFPNTKDVRSKNSFNPRPYFEAYTEPDRKFVQELPNLGKVELYVKEFEDNVTQIIYLRKLLMKVFRDNRSLGNYNAVFICENEKGNKILGDMEEPEHKMWTAEECRKPEKTTEYDVALMVENELKMFINDCLEELLEINDSESIQVSGLEKYLSANDEIGKGSKGDKGNPFTGKPTGNYVKEGSSLTTEGRLKEKISTTRRTKGNVLVVAEGGFSKSPEGKEVGGTSVGENRGKDGPSKPGDNYGTGQTNDNKGVHNSIVEVDWRPIISRKKGYLDVIVYTPYDISNATLQFQIGREGQSKSSEKEDVSIVDSNNGTPEGLSIKGVDLKSSGKNIIQIKFSDKLSHTLKLSVYEIN